MFDASFVQIVYAKLGQAGTLGRQASQLIICRSVYHYQIVNISFLYHGRYPHVLK